MTDVFGEFGESVDVLDSVPSAVAATILTSAVCGVGNLILPLA